MNKLLRTRMKVSESNEANRQLTICLHPNKEKLLFLDDSYNGYYINLSIINKFSFDTKYLFLKLGNCNLAFSRVEDGGTDDDFKELIKEVKTIKAESKDDHFFYASDYLKEQNSYGTITKNELEQQGVILPNGPAALKPKMTDKEFEDTVIASFASNRKITRDLQRQIDEVTLNEMKAKTLSNSEGNVELHVSDIMREVQNMSMDDLSNPASAPIKKDVIPAGFKMVGGDDIDQDFPVYRSREEDEEDNQGKTIVVDRKEIEEELMKEENNKPKKKKKKSSQNLKIFFLILLILVLLGLIGLICTDNLDVVLNLLPL